MTTVTDLGYDINEENVDLFDSIIVNNETDEGIKAKLKKLQFIKILQNKHNKLKGPIRQIMEKMGKLEKTYANIQMDNRRLVSDMDTLTQIVKNFSAATKHEHRNREVEKEQDINLRKLTYSWNNKYGT